MLMPVLPLLLFVAVQGASTPARAEIPAQPALTQAIERADAELFDLSFNLPCDEPRFRVMIADDMEFYHDKDGLVARSAEEFLAVYRRQCGGRADPCAWRSRRELVPATLSVDPIPGWGAMEVGDHLF
jgi:hypothetical protein